MQRRALLGGLALLLPSAACAQTDGAMPPSGAYPGGGMPSPADGSMRRRADDSGAPRRRTIEMSWDEMPPRKRRRMQQRLAGDGNPPLPPEEARRMWEGMTPRQRRQATRRTDGEGRQARAGRMDDGTGEPRMRRRDMDRQMPPAGGPPPSGYGSPPSGYGAPPTQ